MINNTRNIKNVFIYEKFHRITFNTKEEGDKVVNWLHNFASDNGLSMDINFENVEELLVEEDILGDIPTGVSVWIDNETNEAAFYPPDWVDDLEAKSEEFLAYVENMSRTGEVSINQEWPFKPIKEDVTSDNDDFSFDWAEDDDDDF